MGPKIKVIFSPLLQSQTNCRAVLYPTNAKQFYIITIFRGYDSSENVYFLYIMCKTFQRLVQSEQSSTLKYKSYTY